MDSTNISVCDKSSILKRYRYFLSETKRSGINNKAELDLNWKNLTHLEV